MAGTPRLSLPLLAVGQAQKEASHNESLQTLDVIVAGAVEEPPLATPPASPPLGATYIVADAATGAWAGNDRNVAAWTSGGWRFVAATEGMALFDRTSGTWEVFRNGAWEIGMMRAVAVIIGGQQVVGARASAIPSPSGGPVVDAEGRTAIAAILDTLRQHGLIET